MRLLEVLIQDLSTCQMHVSLYRKGVHAGGKKRHLIVRVNLCV